MLFVHRTPAPPLDAFIASVWYCENEPRPFGLERVLPSAAGQLIVNLKEDRTRTYDPALTTMSGTVLSGISSRYSIIDTAEQECVAGVSFKPGGCPIHESCDLESVWGRARVSELRDRLLSARTPAAKLDVLEDVIRRCMITAAFHPAVAYALDVFAQRPDLVRIGMIADSAGLSSKRFIERFKSSVGLAPKHFCRLLRFQSAVGRAERGRRVDWTRIALDSGYFDQAHFIRDFRSFAGITPTGYDAGRTEFRNHVKFVQSEAAAGMR